MDEILYGKQIYTDHFSPTLDARGLLVRQRRGASERVVLVGERPPAQAVKSFECADPITLPFISPESKFDPGNLIGRLKKGFLNFLKELLLVKCAMILAKPVLRRYNLHRSFRTFSFMLSSILHCCTGLLVSAVIRET